MQQPTQRVTADDQPRDRDRRLRDPVALPRGLMPALVVELAIGRQRVMELSLITAAHPTRERTCRRTCRALQVDRCHALLEGDLHQVIDPGKRGDETHTEGAAGLGAHGADLGTEPVRAAATGAV